jgi:hypothetical protein
MHCTVGDSERLRFDRVVSALRYSVSSLITHTFIDTTPTLERKPASDLPLAVGS